MQRSNAKLQRMVMLAVLVALVIAVVNWIVGRYVFYTVE